MEFYHLRSFVAVAQTGNLTQAAKRLYTTPPSISAHIKALEDELSTPLFIRSSKGMALTEKGQLLLEKTQITLDSAMDLVNLAASNQQEIIGSFRLGINLTPQQAKLTQLIENVHENHPRISLYIHTSPTGISLNKMREQQLDGSFIFGDVPDDYIGLAIMEKEITTVAPLSFNSETPVTTQALINQQWIMMGDYCPFDDLLKSKLGNNIPSVLKTSDDGTRLALVKEGLGISFLEKDEALLAEKNIEVIRIPALDFSITLHFTIAKNRAEEPVMKALIQAIKTVYYVK